MGGLKSTQTYENIHSQSFDDHIGLDLNENEHFEVPRSSSPMKWDQANRKKKDVEGSSSHGEDTRVTLHGLNNNIERMLKIAQKNDDFKLLMKNVHRLLEYERWIVLKAKTVLRRNIILKISKLYIYLIF